MPETTARIEKLIQQLDSRSLEQLQTYLEYLVLLQQKVREQPFEKSRYEIIRQFKGDAPFPNVNVSKYDVYAQ